MNNLELRMYGMVPYNISPIQQGIQYGHAVVEYGQKIKRLSTNGDIFNDYNEWANGWKTFIILNGGTTNLNESRLGSLNQHLQTLQNMGVFCATFYEPDLGDQLTAITFIVDERVFDREKYPDFIEPSLDDILCSNRTGSLVNTYQSWVEQFGDDEDTQKKILALREFLHPKNFKLA